MLPTTTTDNASTRSQISTLGAATQTKSPVERSGGSKNVGAIVGGVFGAVIGVLLVGGLAFCILRRRKEKRRDQSFGGSQIADVREVPGWAAPSHHVPTVTGTTGSVTGFYVRRPMTSNVNSLTHHPFPMCRTRMIRVHTPRPRAQWQALAQVILGSHKSCHESSAERATNLPSLPTIYPRATYPTF